MSFVHRFPKAGFLAAALAATLCSAVPVAAQAQHVFVQVAPPPMVQEVIPAPRPGFIWVQGHHEWRHRHYVWVPGVWMRERVGYAYMQPRWEQRGTQWVYMTGGWERHNRMHAYGDRDHDGVPNRYDHDRDGDGVPNRYDRAPNDPYRR